MKEYVKELVTSAKDARLAGRTVVEYLQARVLGALQDAGAFRSWCFHGGTALRFLYSMPRFSEDLDFSLLWPDHALPLRDVVEKVRRVFEDEAYGVALGIKDARTVRSAMLRFQGLPYELGLSPQRASALSVKVELDTRPPAGAETESTLVRRHVVLHLPHHDKATLLAGKLHAILARPYLKGRDLFDLAWYLADPSWPAPNIAYLGNALRQTGWDGPDVSPGNWPDLVKRRLQGMRWSRVVDDVRPFLERPGDLDLLTRQNLFGLLVKRRT